MVNSEAEELSLGDHAGRRASSTRQARSFPVVCLKKRRVEDAPTNRPNHQSMPKAESSSQEHGFGPSLILAGRTTMDGRTGWPIGAHVGWMVGETRGVSSQPYCVHSRLLEQRFWFLIPLFVNREGLLGGVCCSTFQSGDVRQRPFRECFFLTRSAVRRCAGVVSAVVVHGILVFRRTRNGITISL
jgi:hypothetical protein